MTQIEPAILEERQVDFYGDTILAILIRMDGRNLVVVPVRPICTVLGITWSPQRLRINRDEVLSTCVIKLITQVPGDTQRREHLCLPLDYLHGWLFGITTSQVKEQYRHRITLYRRECFQVLSASFQPNLALPDTEVASGKGSGMTLAQVRDLALAVAQMAEQQMALEDRVDETHALAIQAHDRLNKAAQVIMALQQRTHSLEEKFNPGEMITEEQAAEISTQVKALAHFLSARETGKNHYQGVFGELYRRFGVTSYTRIPQSRYGEVLAFLEDWRKATMRNDLGQDDVEAQ